VEVIRLRYPFFHKTRVPCVPTNWWLVTLSVDGALAEHVAPQLLSQEAVVRDQRARLLSASTSEYAFGLSRHAVVQHERNLLEAQLLVFNVLLARHLNKDSKCCRNEIDQWLRDIQVYTNGLRDFLRDGLPGVHRRRLITKELRARFSRKPNGLRARLQQLIGLLSTKEVDC
jgi:hypothetical protein